MRFKFQIQYQYATRERTGTKLGKDGKPKPYYTTVWHDSKRPKLINARTREQAEVKFRKRFFNVRIKPRVKQVRYVCPDCGWTCTLALEYDALTSKAKEKLRRCPCGGKMTATVLDPQEANDEHC